MVYPQGTEEGTEYSNLVGAGRVAQDLEKIFKEAKKKSGKAKKHQTSKTANNFKLHRYQFHSRYLQNVLSH